MKLSKPALFICAICILIHPSFAQNEQSAYLNAKQHFSVGSYKLAMEGFKRLSNPNAKHDFVEYASFYYGLSAYKNGDLGLARSMWLQVEKKYPRWNKITEVNYWLSNVYFEEGNYELGISYAKKLSFSKEQELVSNYINELDDIDQLNGLNEEYPDDKAIAIQLASSIVKQPLSKRDFSKLEFISTKFNLNQSAFGLPDIGSSVKKDSYNVAVILPFMFTDLENLERVARNKFVLDLYEGILTAVDTLNAQKSAINLFPYDTKRNADSTSLILEKDELKSMDLIIGPLFPEPSKVVSDFCFEQKINMVNPVSSNDMVIDNNPYSFLFKPSNLTIASRMADYATSTIDNKNTFIFFDDTEKDSLAAYAYKEIIEAENFEVIHCLKVDLEEIGDAHALLTDLYEIGLNQNELDSLLEIDEKLVKEKKVEMEDSNEDSVIYYQEFFNISADSIGHIFVSSSKPLHASSFVSAVEIRPDTIPILTNGDWMNYDMLTINQLQRLTVKFADPDFINFSKTSVNSFRSIIRKKYKKEPSLNNYIGYEMMFYIGGMMKSNGNYFQKGALKAGKVKGQIFEGIEYNVFNSNQVVPIVTFENDELINLNRQ